MWLDAFESLADPSNQSLEARLFRDEMPLRLDGSRLQSSAMQRASGILAAKLALGADTSDRQRLNVIIPGTSPQLGQLLPIFLLLADFVHREGSRVPTEERGPLVRGDILLVTQSIRRCVEALRKLGVMVSGTIVPISTYWTIEVLSQYAPAASDRPRLFVANPGWSDTFHGMQKFGCVIVDALHPRTAAHLSRLLTEPSIAGAPLQILLEPAWGRQHILQHKDANLKLNCYWMWDASASRAVEALLRPQPTLSPRARDVWVCDDEEVNESLCGLHTSLVQGVKLSGGQAPDKIFEAWAIYHRLRTMAVPLRQAEEQQHGHGWMRMSLGKRIESLKQPTSSEAALSAFLEVEWPKLIEGLRYTYGLILSRAEPAKFYSVANAVTEYLSRLQKSPDPLRIVAPTMLEGTLLLQMLGDVVDGFPAALQDGLITVSTIRAEPRQIAEGQQASTLLLGFRTSAFRYLNVYPETDTYVAAYPYEAEVDTATQAALYDSISSLSTDGERCATLAALRMGFTSSHYGSVQSLEPFVPEPRIHTAPGQKPRLIRVRTPIAIEAFELDNLAGMTWTDDVLLPEATESSVARAQGVGSLGFVEVEDDAGHRVRYAASHLIDVYYPTTRVWERLPAAELKPGMRMLLLVDDRYQDLFQRLLEAINEQRDVRSSLAMELWSRAKQSALSKHHGNRSELHLTLDRQGLSVDYGAVVGWFRTGEDEILGPDRWEDFSLLARESGLLPDEVSIRNIFRVISQERVHRRVWGKHLRKFLACIADGQHYEEALKGAEAFGTLLEDVAAAISIREIEAVRWA
jgi:hypothetical protein